MKMPLTTRTLARCLEAVCWAFAVLGLTLPFVYESPVFVVYRDSVAQWAYASSVVPVEDQRLLGLMLGICAGSIAGKWIVHALLARGPLAEGRAWARDLTLAGIAVWFLLDSAASLAIGAGFQVWMINLLPLLLVAAPLIAARERFTEAGLPELARGIDTRAARLCFVTALLGAATGVGIAFGGSTPLFSLWWSRLEAAHYGSAPLDAEARRLALLFFGPIGGCTFAQFLMLAGWIRREVSRRVAIAALTSIAGWFLIDSGYGLAHDGLFNIAIVNLPALLLTLPAWLWLLYILRGRQASGQAPQPT